MLTIHKLVNFVGNHVFYLSDGSGAIEIHFGKNNLNFNYLGSDLDKKISSSYALFSVCRDDNEKVYGIFDSLYNNVKNEYDLMISRGVAGEVDGLNSIMSDNKIVCNSDSSPFGNVNKLIIEPCDNVYNIHFIKGRYLDGRNNRSFKVKISHVNSKLGPFSNDFTQLYDDLLSLEDIDVFEQNSYNLSKSKK